MERSAGCIGAEYRLTQITGRSSTRSDRREGQTSTLPFTERRGAALHAWPRALSLRDIQTTYHDPLPSPGMNSSHAVCICRPSLDVTLLQNCHSTQRTIVALRWRSARPVSEYWGKWKAQRGSILWTLGIPMKSSHGRDPLLAGSYLEIWKQ